MRQCLILITLLIVVVISPVFSQSNNYYSSLTIAPSLKKKANAVVRYDKQVIQVEDFDKIVVTTKRIVTIFNESGNRHQNAYEGYDSNTKIKTIEARIFDVSGEEIKKIKERDFNDQSAVSGGTLYSDSRVKFLDYTPIGYPYTLEYISEVEMRSTAFIPQWRPIDGYHISVEFSEFQIVNNSEIELRTKTENFENFEIEVLNNTHVKATNLKAIPYEAYSPGILNIVPTLKTALTSFNMEGVKGENHNWEDFGKWVYDKLLMGTDHIPQSAIDDVKKLTLGITDTIQKAKIVYKYMQDRTRYISVQVGIGGWKPIDAMEVDKLGYGDCKGLTNYTKALLEAVGVPSYYTLVWGGSDIKNIDKDFSVAEGNHAILYLSNNGEDIFLECTSQTNPFGFTAGFTDDRDVLLVTSNGGKIARTKVYDADDSKQITHADVLLDDLGGFTANVKVSTTGYQYSLHEPILTKTTTDQELYYKNYWSNINNLTLHSLAYINDTDGIVFTESVELSAKNYASKSGKRLILEPNMFNSIKDIPPRYENRKLDFKLQRAFKDTDEFIIQLPSNIEVEAMSEGETLETKFGSYSYNIQKVEDNKLKYTREYVMYKGAFDKDDYEAFRDFRKQIVKLDKTKIVLITK